MKSKDEYRYVVYRRPYGGQFCREAIFKTKGAAEYYINEQPKSGFVTYIYLIEPVIVKEVE